MTKKSLDRIKYQYEIAKQFVNTELENFKKIKEDYKPNDLSWQFKYDGYKIVLKNSLDNCADLKKSYRRASNQYAKERYMVKKLAFYSEIDVVLKQLKNLGKIYASFFRTDVEGFVPLILLERYGFDLSVMPDMSDFVTVMTSCKTVLDKDRDFSNSIREKFFKTNNDSVYFQAYVMEIIHYWASSCIAYNWEMPKSSAIMLMDFVSENTGWFSEPNYITCDGKEYKISSISELKNYLDSEYKRIDHA